MSDSDSVTTTDSESFREKYIIMQKYATREMLTGLCSPDEYKAFEASSNDTINETALLETLKKTGCVDELFHATAQMAIVGFGGKQFNQYKYKGESKELKTLFSRCGVNYTCENQSKLGEGELTPRRLLRLFRVQIQNLLIERSDLASYLYLKYASKEIKEGKENFRTVCYPGSENLVEDKENAKMLLDCYKKLDKDLEKFGKPHGISERIERILLARNMI